MLRDAIGDRMKTYEAASATRVDFRQPVIIRLDGRAFSSYTQNLNQPFDGELKDAMNHTMQSLCERIPCCVFGYSQSDEISLCIINGETSQLWFGGRLQKIVSVTASMATASFNSVFHNNNGRSAEFDSRVFNIPKYEIVNYFIWRQFDAERNSINQVGRYMFGKRGIFKKNSLEVSEMLTNNGTPFTDYPARFRLGSVCYPVLTKFTAINQATGDKEEVVRNKWFIEDNSPRFVSNKEYVTNFLE